MSEFKLLDIDKAHHMIADGKIVVADIRKQQSFGAGHVANLFLQRFNK